ncbi:pyruvate dehydrogenase E1 component subunit beta-4, chloroplastic-like [Miscanthus floridulus]|uniref:pyruvate dehydrogenase E1 component subunit beta-4, chloroplastic-like n=1 Tax=Miscanthus floridulus TaxID=154761 RepID=UPI00345A9B63
MATAFSLSAAAPATAPCAGLRSTSAARVVSVAPAAPAGRGRLVARAAVAAKADAPSSAVVGKSNGWYLADWMGYLFSSFIIQEVKSLIKIIDLKRFIL